MIWLQIPALAEIGPWLGKIPIDGGIRNNQTHHKRA